MPIFRFSKVFSIARAAKVFVNVEGGITRGAEGPRSDSERAEALKERLGDARKLVREQRKALESKDKEIEEQAQRQTEGLAVARRVSHGHRRELWRRNVEIFHLNNELAATRGLVEGAQDGPLASGAPAAPEVGRLPDFVVIGAQRCGTGFFYGLLTRHPNVERAAVKEVHYFGKQENFAKGIEWYRRCFPSPTQEDGQLTITGEATPSYLFGPHIPERLAGAVPGARLIVLLRNPVDRAYSHYHMAVIKGRELRSFEEAIEEERAWLLEKEDAPSRPRLADTSEPGGSSEPAYAYLRRGIYVDQLLRWREFFGDEQMLVLKSEDLFERPQESLKLVLEYLDLPYWEPELQSDKTKKAKRRYEPMDPATRRRLEDFFKPHNWRLYEHLGVDLGW